MMCLMLAGSIAFTSCGLEDDLDTNQYVSGTHLLAFGPSPVARGGQLRILGSGLDQVVAVDIPGCSEITSIERISSEEIRITVPQDAEPGQIVLKTQDGKTLTSVSRISYTEPVGFDEGGAMTPNPVKAGQKLTIKGEYLNLVTSVILANKVSVSDFVSHSRNEISLVVPAEAQTGKIILSFCATGDTIPNEIYSDSVLYVVAPAVESVISLDKKKPGDVVTITGTDMDLVTAVVMDATGDSIDFESTDTSVKFKMPDNVTNSIFSVRTASELTIAIATIGVAVPEVESVEPSTSIRPNDVITITGKNLELVTGVNFPVQIGEPIHVDLEPGASPEKIQVRMPNGAYSGNFALCTAANIYVDVPFETAKPIFESYSENPISLGSTLTIKGKNMDLVTAVEFTGGSIVSVESTVYDEVSLAVPYANAETGKLTLHMSNGEFSEAGELTLNAPECCYVTEWPSLEEDQLINAGEILQVSVANSDKLTGVKIDGQDCQYILNAETKLYISVPSTAGKSSQITLESSNGSITYDYAFQPNTEITTTLWEGIAKADDWNNQPYVLSDGGDEFTNAGVVAGDEITFYISPMETDWKLQIVEGHWGPTYASICSLGNETEGGKFTEYDLKGNNGKFALVLTEEMITAAMTKQGWGGIFVLNGDKVIVTKITTTHHISLETTLWKGEVDLGSWSINWTIGDGKYGASNPSMFVDAGLSVGQTIRVYVTNTNDWWQIQFFDGHWAGQEEIGNATGLNNGNNINSGIYSLSDHNGAIEIPVTATLQEQLTTIKDWGYCWIIQGENLVVNKITLE